jgi:RES domain-containing protein
MSAMSAGETNDSTRALDQALADTFPASDPPAQTSPSAATPSSAFIADKETGELRIYRVIEPDQAHAPFAAAESGGRWSPPGMRCVYASLSPATALLEYLAHLEGRTPASLLLAVGMIPSASVLSEINEPSTWGEFPYRPEVQQVGAAWLRSRASLGMRVPSALCRDECNLLLNPEHPEYAALQLVALRPLQIDERIRT